jgi:flavin reductase (DIM6/NTAB) family NADH-FMN oxidoreductase RutF
MDEAAKKTALRMIPYGIYVLTAQASDGSVAAATVNWVTQASFAPPLVAVAVKGDSGAHAIVKSSGVFALNVLGKGQQKLAFTFFKPAELSGKTVSGEAFRTGTTGAPVLENAIAFIECRVVNAFEGGDHTVFTAEVIEAGVAKQPDGRADDATLWMKDLGEKVFYGG